VQVYTKKTIVTVAMLPTPTKENSSTSENPLSPDMSWYIRRQERTAKKDSDAANSLLLLQQSTNICSNSDERDDETGTEIQTKVAGDLIDSMTCELQKLRTENIDLNAQIQRVSQKIWAGSLHGEIW